MTIFRFVIFKNEGLADKIDTGIAVLVATPTFYTHYLTICKNVHETFKQINCPRQIIREQ